jgi:hypothetical protein
MKKKIFKYKIKMIKKIIIIIKKTFKKKIDYGYVIWEKWINVVVN